METPVREKVDHTPADHGGFAHDEAAIVSDWFSEDRGRWAEDTRTEDVVGYNVYMKNPGSKGAL